MNPVKSWVVTGPGGSRIDFLAGWLGTLNNFVDTQWSLDVVTGSSSGEARITKFLDSNAELQLKDILEGHNMTPVANAELTIATTCHGNNLTKQIKGIDADALKIIFVDISMADRNRLHWEFTVKTYMTQVKDLHALKNKTVYPGVDRLIKSIPSDSTRILEVEKILTRELKYRPVPLEISNVILDYTQIFCSTGIEYLEKELGIAASQRHRDTWQHLLQIATSPDEIFCFGKMWKFDDFFN